jgi:hypothetical protein
LAKPKARYRDATPQVVFSDLKYISRRKDFSSAPTRDLWHRCMNAVNYPVHFSWTTSRTLEK